MRYLFALVLALAAGLAHAGECPVDHDPQPSEDSTARVLEGQVVAHHGIRDWTALVPDSPTCGQAAIELVEGSDAVKRLAQYDGCHVRTTGILGFALTGYYSTPVFQSVTAVDAPAACERKAAPPDMSGVEPAADVHDYQVEMDVDYRPGDYPVVFHVTRDGAVLTPWQAYAAYDLTGGFVLYGRCGKGFVVGRAWGTPEASPTGDDTEATFDPEGAADHGVTDLRLFYTCTREASTEGG